MAREIIQNYSICFQTETTLNEWETEEAIQTCVAYGRNLYKGH